MLGIDFVLCLDVPWLLGRTEDTLLGIATGVTAIAFILLGLYLFVREESLASG